MANHHIYYGSLAEATVHAGEPQDCLRGSTKEYAAECGNAAGVGKTTDVFITVVYVCRLLHIGRIRMDIDNPGYLGPRQTCKASNVSML
jgi:hypothetical protein